MKMIISWQYKRNNYVEAKIDNTKKKKNIEIVYVVKMTKPMI